MQMLYIVRQLLLFYISQHKLWYYFVTNFCAFVTKHPVRDAITCAFNLASAARCGEIDS